MEMFFLLRAGEVEHCLGAGAQVSDAHGGGRGIAFHLSEAFHLDAAGEGNQGIGGEVVCGGNEAHGEENDTLQQDGQLSPVEYAILPADEMGRLCNNDAKGKGEHREKVAESFHKVSFRKGYAE